MMPINEFEDGATQAFERFGRRDCRIKRRRSRDEFSQVVRHTSTPGKHAN
jgi:hypothetical protein